MHKKNGVLKIVIFVLLLLGALAMIFPFVWMILSSFKSNADAIAIPPNFFETPFTLEHYKTLFTELNFGLYFKNTVFVVILSFSGIVFNSLAGYGFAKFDFPHKEKLFLLFMATMMIPAQVIMISVYMMIFNLHLTNTFLGMVLPGLVTGFSIFLFRQFFENIPDEIVEAGRIEGFSEFQIFRKLIVPIAKPVFAIQSILVFIHGWNSFLWPTLISSTQATYTLSVGLNLLQSENANEVALLMAGASVMIVPVLIVFFIFQRKIIDGISFTGGK